MWHKNMRKMQVGGKSDEAGWPAYEDCLKMGAIVLTGHEHSYSRTYEMNAFANFRISQNDPSEIVLRDQDEVRDGSSFVMVSGVGGRGIRTYQDNLYLDPHWAFTASSNTGLQSGSVICKFHSETDRRDRAYCYFKEWDGDILDEWHLTSEVHQFGFEQQKTHFITVQESNDADDAEQEVATNTMLCPGTSGAGGSSDLELSADGTTQQRVYVRFRDVPMTSTEVRICLLNIVVKHSRRRYMQLGSVSFLLTSSKSCNLICAFH